VNQQRKRMWMKEKTRVEGVPKHLVIIKNERDEGKEKGKGRRGEIMKRKNSSVEAEEIGTVWSEPLLLAK
jgi:hypothetical protein